MKLDPKLRNLILYSSLKVLSIIFIILVYITLTQEFNIFRLIGHFVLILIGSRGILWTVRWKFLMSSQPWKHRKWAIVIDNGDIDCLLTSVFAHYVTTRFQMNVCVFSDNQSKLEVVHKYLISNSSKNATDTIKPSFRLVYADSNNLINLFETHLKLCDQDGGIGLFLNTLCQSYLKHNFSWKMFEESDMTELNAVVIKKLLPSVWLSSLALQCMKPYRQGAILHVCSPSRWMYDRNNERAARYQSAMQTAIR